MLKPELAREQLQKLQSKKNKQARLARLQKLSKAAAAHAMGFFGLLPNGKSPKEWRDRNKLSEASGRVLNQDDKLRAKVLAALFPTLHTAIEAGWQLLGRMPYTVDSNRRAFRAPNRPAVYATTRQGFVRQLFEGLAEYPDTSLTVEWVATWAAHLGWRSDEYGYLLAAAVDAGGKVGEQVLSIVKDSAANRHEIGGPGGHTTRALLCSQRPEAWEFAENLLLAAQRQEGLRQSILKAVDEAHPEAFRRMVGVLLDQNLIRFASVARAAGVWFGGEETVENAKKLKADLQSCRELLNDPAARTQAIAKGDATTAYRGLWALAFEDSEVALKAALPLLKDQDLGRRVAAAKLAAETGLSEVATAMLPLLDDPELPIISLALNYFTTMPNAETSDDDDDTPHSNHPPDLFDRLVKLMPKLPAKEKELKSPVPDWFMPSISQEDAADLLWKCLGKRPVEKLLPFMLMMSEYTRVHTLAKLCEARTLSSQVRQTLLAIAGEPNHYVREAALKHLKNCKLAEDEVQTLEGYLSRKTADFRRSVFELLLNRPDPLVVGSVDRLLAAGDANRRAAGIEISRRMVDAERMAEPIREKLRDYREAKGKRLVTAEADAIEIILNPAARPPSLADGLDLYDPKGIAPVIPPKKRKVKLATPASVAFLKELDNFIHEHRTKTYVDTRYAGRTEEKVLGSIRYRWDFPGPNDRKSVEEDRANLPLLDLWESWWENRSAKTRDSDGLELLRASKLTREEVREGELGSQDDDEDFDDDDDDDNTSKKEKPSAAKIAFEQALEQISPYDNVKVRYDDLMDQLLPWFLKLHPPKGASTFILDAAEHSLALLPPIVLDKLPKPKPPENSGDNDDDDDDDKKSEDEVIDWRDSRITNWLDVAEGSNDDADWTTEHDKRLYQLCHWLDQPVPGVARKRPDLEILLRGYVAGVANLEDFYDHLIGPRGRERWSGESFNALRDLTGDSSKEQKIVGERPELQEAVDKVLARILELELARGETPTEVTPAANDIKRIVGSETLFRLIAGLGKAGYVKSSSYRANQNKPAVLTSLIQTTVPGPADTTDAFAKAVKAAVNAELFPLERIVELGLVNPRWVYHVTASVGWPGYEEAVYWLIAHTGSSWGNRLEDGEDSDDEDDSDIDEATDESAKKSKPENPWQAIVKARTNLTAEQRADGLIDVSWFHKAYEAVGSEKRWDTIESAAKFLGYGQSHKKAARLADVLLGRMKKKELVDGIRTKFLKESVRLLGLLPLPDDDAKREDELADRYKVLKEYERYARGLSSLSKEPAMQAARLGMENLAVTAGFADPVRLEWAVTASEVADLVTGSETVTVKTIAVSLALNSQGDPEVTQTKAGEPVGKIPPDVKKDAKVAELFERKKSLTRMAANTKRSLEQAMCSGDQFRGSELKGLMNHALVKPLLERLVLKSPQGMGYPVKGGTALKSFEGKSTPLKAGDAWSIAHPLDFVKAKNWHEWQANCFKVERLQPFKQVFREVYVLTPAEKEDGDRSRRYSGQQVNETQAKALLAGRGWSTREGFDKLFRDANLVVDLQLDSGYSTPADAAAPAVGQVVFHQRGDWKQLKLADVPPVIFSEVMRDLDLVVSVAHVGGVDPEATQSTVEMRAALLRETTSLLKLANVKLDSRHALIEGEYGRYSVHLGSGVVHKQPGGSLCVVPVNAQHRGRLFLPFADDDPRTAEVISKVLMLARDKEIQDPTILQQITAK